MKLPSPSTILIVPLLVLAACQSPKPAPPVIVHQPVVVKAPSCLDLVGESPAPPASDTAPAPPVNVDVALAALTKLRADGDQVADVAPLAALAAALAARLRDAEDPAWIAYRVQLEAWRATVSRTCR